MIDRTRHAAKAADALLRPAASLVRRWAFVANAVLLASATALLWLIPLSYRGPEYLAALIRDGDPPRAPIDSLAALIAFAATATLIALAVSLLSGPRRERSVAGYLRLTGLVCGWLVLVSHWETVYAWGQARRVAANLDPLVATAQRLQAVWPNEDGTVGDLGPFLAYPKGDPTCLLMLGDAGDSRGKLSVSAVERSDSVLRFELAGDELPTWVVRRPDDTPAQSFKSGLGGHYTVAWQIRLAPGWRLVRYR